MRSYDEILNSIKDTLMQKGNADNIKASSLNMDLRELEIRFKTILSTDFLKNLLKDSNLTHNRIKDKVNSFRAFFLCFEQNRYFKQFSVNGIVRQKERLTFLKAK